MFKIKLILLAVIFSAGGVWALQPEEVLVIVNSDIPDSVETGEFYLSQRGLPEGNILRLPLGGGLSPVISRGGYEEKILKPVRSVLSKPEYKDIKCLLTVYGVAYRISQAAPKIEEVGQHAKLREKYSTCMSEVVSLNSKLIEVTPGGENVGLESINPLGGARKELEKFNKNIGLAFMALNDIGEPAVKNALREELAEVVTKFAGHFRGAEKLKRYSVSVGPVSGVLRGVAADAKKDFEKARKEQWSVARKLKEEYYRSVRTLAGVEGMLIYLEMDMDRIDGRETSAALDSELAMARFDEYSLYRWQENELHDRIFWFNVKTLMVSRLDGPTPQVARGLVRKAVEAEKAGLEGRVYIDTGYEKAKTVKEAYGEYEQSLIETAELFRERTEFAVTVDSKAEVFGLGQCPDTAIYCGWYSLRKYVDAFDFKPGAIGYHIASLEAVDIRDPLSSQWVPAMLQDGITASMGAVSEPYLRAFPKPDEFFGELVRGKTLAEAFFRSKPFNSWQIMLIGDPLYRPFK